MSRHVQARAQAIIALPVCTTCLSKAPQLGLDVHAAATVASVLLFQLATGHVLPVLPQPRSVPPALRPARGRVRQSGGRSSQAWA